MSATFYEYKVIERTSALSRTSDGFIERILVLDVITRIRGPTSSSLIWLAFCQLILSGIGPAPNWFIYVGCLFDWYFLYDVNSEEESVLRAWRQTKLIWRQIGR